MNMDLQIDITVNQLQIRATGCTKSIFFLDVFFKADRKKTFMYLPILLQNVQADTESLTVSPASAGLEASTLKSLLVGTYT